MYIVDNIAWHGDHADTVNPVVAFGQRLRAQSGQVDRVSSYRVMARQSNLYVKMTEYIIYDPIYHGWCTESLRIARNPVISSLMWRDDNVVLHRLLTARRSVSSVWRH